MTAPKIAIVTGPRGRRAVTHWRVITPLDRAALVECRLETGRTHQIRVHMAAIGHPVCGDPTYGAAAEYGLTRQFLHAARLAFPHPVGGEPVEVSSELPSDLVKALLAAEQRSPGQDTPEIVSGRPGE